MQVGFVKLLISLFTSEMKSSAWHHSLTHLLLFGNLMNKKVKNCSKASKKIGLKKVRQRECCSIPVSLLGLVLWGEALSRCFK